MNGLMSAEGNVDVNHDIHADYDDISDDDDDKG